MSSTMSERIYFGSIKEAIEPPNLIEVQANSYVDFLQKDVQYSKRKNQGLQAVFKEVFPIESYDEKAVLDFSHYDIGEPKLTALEAQREGQTYSAPLHDTFQLREERGTKEEKVYMGEIPLMTPQGTFVINGAERVVVSQLHRSPGIAFESTIHVNVKVLYSFRIIPDRGSWIEVQFDTADLLYIYLDRRKRRRKFLATTFLHALGYGLDEDVIKLFYNIETLKLSEKLDEEKLATKVLTAEIRDGEVTVARAFEPLTLATIRQVMALGHSEVKVIDISNDDTIVKALRKDPAHDQEEALKDIYRRLRPGDPPTVANARALLKRLFFDPKKYDLGRVGRYKINQKLGIDVDLTERILTDKDFIAAIKYLINLRRGEGTLDDIDHLGSRRVRTVGELLANQCRVGLALTERLVKERMTLFDINVDGMTPQKLINPKALSAVIRDFFGRSQLSQFMDQTNPLAELTHKRRLSALGPGGLSRDRAGFDVRDVHPSHYGRVCPIETPEGPNIGLMLSLATYGKINQYGFIETPYRRVISQLVVDDPALPLEGQILRDDAVNPDSGKVVLAAGTVLDDAAIKKIQKAGIKTIRVKPVASEIIDYLSADREELVMIAQANTPLDEQSRLIPDEVVVRVGGGHRFPVVPAEQVAYMDVSPKQVVSVATALIPFLEHDDANRALMGANMQRQAVPLLQPRAPVVGTGVEHQAARDSGQVLVAGQNGVVRSVSGRQIIIVDDDGNVHEYNLQKFVRSNQDTCINQRPSVRQGERVTVGQIIADSSSTENGELALGQNVVVAFMPWEGGNFEDAILISERLVRDDVFTSIHIEKYETEARDTKLGPEEITRDIPNVGEESLANLDENGVIRIGAEVRPNDILVGKVTPRGETELSAEERLLRAIFGEKAREVKDTSLRVPHGVHGKVIDVKTFRRDDDSDHELPAGVNEMVRVSIAQKRKISEGDKMAGRHGNKGVISRILPIEDMPFLPDGTSVDIILNPIGVPSRMNLGQVLETHLGWAASKLGFRVATPVFDGAREDEIKDLLAAAGLPEDGKVDLYDGRSGEKFDRPVTVGVIYMLKLAHLVEDKIHARSTGPYSLVTQQPLGGKAQFGGQRFGEMEVWALYAYGAAYTLQEMLTVKSDDTVGRVKTYEAIVKGDEITGAGVPESFKVLVKELRSLGLSIDVINEDEQTVEFTEDTSRDLLSNLDRINLSGFERTVD